MLRVSFRKPSRQVVASAMLVLLSVVTVAYAPLSAVSMADSTNQANAQALKQKAQTTLKDRIDSYVATLESMNIKTNITANSSSVTFSSDRGSITGSFTKKCNDEKINWTNPAASPSPLPSPASYSLNVSDGNLVANVTVYCRLQAQAVQFLEQVISELQQTYTSVVNSATDEVNQLVQNINTQLNLDQLTQLQASVTQAVSSMTDVLSDLQASYSAMQSQVNNLVGCAKGVVSGTGTVNVSGSAGSSPTVSGTGDCSDIQKDSTQLASEAQQQLNAYSTIIQTIISIVSSAGAALSAVVSGFTNMLSGSGGLGDLSSLGGGALSSNQLSGLTSLGSMFGGSSDTSGLGSLTGLVTSLTSVLSELNLSSGMSSDALSGLTSLSGLLGN